jgi:hypothetical protein
VKRIISILIAVAVITALTAMPAAAAVSTGVTVGTTSTAPEIVCLTMTPDEVAEGGCDVNPEPAIPNDVAPLFPPTDATEDGWKRVCFYVEIYHQNGVTYENINTVSIDVDYPASFNEVDQPLFGDRAEDLKFEIDCQHDGQEWTADIVYDWTEVYPDGTVAVLPDLAVRELVYNTATDAVDVDADGDPVNDATPWTKSFLDDWGTSKVSYGAGYDSFEAFDLYQLGQAMVLEITGWMWFHQPGVDYPVTAICATINGATSDPINNVLSYQRVAGLYCDFDSVQFVEIETGGDSWNEGDRYLDTSDKTTVWNNGNVGAQVTVWATKMVKDFAGTTIEELVNDSYYGSDSKTIETFDAKLYYCNGEGTVLQLGQILYPADADPIGSPTPVVIENDLYDVGEKGPEGPVLLQQCRPAKIEFSVHPESGQLSGVYKGFLTVGIQDYTGSQLPTL